MRRPTPLRPASTRATTPRRASTDTGWGLTAAASSPFHRPWCWPLAHPAGNTTSARADLEVEALHAAAALLPGEKSFAAFARAGQEHRGDRCIVTEARWTAWALGMEFTILANRFLHHMVRYLVGTMVDIARGRRPLDEMRAMLEDNDGGLVTSPPAPAAGLFLRRVCYPEYAIAHDTAAIAHDTPIADDSATDSGNAATAADTLPESTRSVPFADPAALDSDTDRPLAGSANHS